MTERPARPIRTATSPRTGALLLVVALLLGLLVPQTASAHGSGDVKRDLKRAEGRLERATRGLATVRGQASETRAQLDELTRRLREATARRAALEADLAAKRQRLAEAEARLAEAEQALQQAELRTVEAVAELDAATRELHATETDLSSKQSTLEDQAATAYKYGGGTHISGVLTTVFEGSSPTDIAVNLHFVESIIGHQKMMVERVAAMRDVVSAQRDRIEQLKRRRQHEEEVARGAREQIAALTAEREQLVGEQAALVAEQERVVASVEADQASHQALLKKLEADKAAYEGLVDELERESKQLERELQRQLAREAAARKKRSTGGGRYSAGQPGKGGLAWPTNGRPGSPFGYRRHPVLGTRRLHTGLDIGARSGTPIVAAAAGEVISAGWRGGYGNAVVISHGGGMATLYAHQSRLAVRGGQWVTKGQRIGYVGSTGMSTGPHLHFEVRINGVPRNPMSWY